MYSEKLFVLLIGIICASRLIDDPLSGATGICRVKIIKLKGKSKTEIDLKVIFKCF